MPKSFSFSVFVAIRFYFVYHAVGRSRFFLSLSFHVCCQWGWGCEWFQNWWESGLSSSFFLLLLLLSFLLDKFPISSISVSLPPSLPTSYFLSVHLCFSFYSAADDSHSPRASTSFSSSSSSSSSTTSPRRLSEGKRRRREWLLTSEGSYFISFLLPSAFQVFVFVFFYCSCLCRFHFCTFSFSFLLLLLVSSLLRPFHLVQIIYSYCSSQNMFKKVDRWMNKYIINEWINK